MAKTALVIIDMLNTYDHEDAHVLVPSVERALPAVVHLLDQARAKDLPVIYANDNFGKWRSHHGEILDAALAGPHADLVDPVRPDGNAYFVVKARHSIFYETPLAYLLGTLDVSRLVLCGQVTEQCVLYSALDAHIRHLSVTVAEDAVAHIHRDLADAALRMMEINMGARVVPAAAALRVTVGEVS
ncbi:MULTISPECIES: cysteine hydrolase family protein [unclassified Streptomyces]|uniref:cysteine hydrolase family protein n=1 Tax=unclassified Streptomyces TaxID=2593676 RepID=UPI0022520F19|nr:isochorismatase family cysteine hydrolase [Streptomyces sp. NBC_00047]MCX5613460.1 cysteine hydrolase [Streptomyces sp. NBC_00047]